MNSNKLLGIVVLVGGIIVITAIIATTYKPDPITERIKAIRYINGISESDKVKLIERALSSNTNIYVEVNK